MTLPSDDTVVLYPAGATTSTSRVLHVEAADGAWAVILDRTACHPVDTAWPDQPSDRAVLRLGPREWTVTEAVTAGIRDGELFVGAAQPVRTGTPEWTFVVAHLVAGDPPAEGDEVEVVVDADHRAALNLGHTACHLASLALNAALTDAWTKPVTEDALGRPNFDALAIETSRILRHGSVDTYRIGKSLRRKGFSAAAIDDPGAIAQAANTHLAQWTEPGAPVRIVRDGERLTDRRAWVTEVDGTEARIPCGGTHASHLEELRGVRVGLTREDTAGAVLLTMTTEVPIAS